MIARAAGVRGEYPALGSWRATILLVAGLALPLAAPASAHVVSDREVRVLLDLPPGLVARAAAADLPDSIGRVGPNRPVWTEVHHQQGALLLLIDAASRADSAGAERAWKAIDAAFQQQTPRGDFLAAGKPSGLVHLSGVAAWLAALTRAEVVVMNSPLQERFRWRVSLMLPKLRRSVDFLVAASDSLWSLHRGRPDLLLVDAQAFLLADGIYHEPIMNQLGQRSLVAALDAQQSNGAFWRDGDPPLGVQAHAVASLIEIALYFPAPSLESAARSGADWLERRLHDRPRAGGAGSGSAIDPGPREALRDALVAVAYRAAGFDPGRRHAVEALAERCLPNDRSRR